MKVIQNQRMRIAKRKRKRKIKRKRAKKARKNPKKKERKRNTIVLILIPTLKVKKRGKRSRALTLCLLLPRPHQACQAQAARCAGGDRCVSARLRAIVVHPLITTTTAHAIIPAASTKASQGTPVAETIANTAAEAEVEAEVEVEVGVRFDAIVMGVMGEENMKGKILEMSCGSEEKRGKGTGRAGSTLGKMKEKEGEKGKRAIERTRRKVMGERRGSLVMGKKKMTP